MEVIAKLDLLGWSLTAIVLAVAIAMIAMMARHVSRFRRELEDVDASAYEQPAVSGLHHELRRQFVKRRPDGKLLVREAPDVTLEDWLERQLQHHRSFEAGGWITGIALMFTFFLIALVLARDVGPAIENASDFGNLSRAVATMGSKFLVSLLGIFGSIAHAVARGTLLKRLQSPLLSASQRLASTCVLVGEFHAELAEVTARGVYAISEALVRQHTDNGSRLSELKRSVDRLQSIEVSVKDIGSDLTRSLQQTVKNDVVAAIRRDLEAVTDKVLEGLNASFSRMLGEQLARVTAELQKIEAAVASQARGPVDELLTKLGDAVSGGFSSESSRMKETLARFTEVVPALEQQVRSLLQSAGEDQSRRDLERSKMSEVLVAQIERMIHGLEQQQAASLEANDEMREFAGRLQRELSQSVAQANEQILARSRVSLDELTGAVRSATGDAAEVYRELVKEVGASATILRDARGETEASARHLSQAAAAVQSQVRSLLEGMSVLRGASESLARAADGARGAAKETTDALRSGQEIVSQQQRFLEDLAGKWPELTKAYLTAADQAFSAVASAWDTQSQRISDSVTQISRGFSETAGQFASAVEDLGQQVALLNRAMQGGPKSQPRSAR